MVSLGGLWAKRWLDTRREQCLHAVNDGTLAPARDHGRWMNASADIAEANEALRIILVKTSVAEEVVKEHGTHACQATRLAWGANAGLNMENRRWLGGHARSKERMVLGYS